MGWELFRRDGDGDLEMVGIDGAVLAEGIDPALPLACEITIDAPSAAPDVLAGSERQVAEIAIQLGGRVVGSCRSATRLVILAQLPTDAQAGRFTEIALPRQGSVSVAPSNDPSWSLFDRFRPLDREEQSMDDLAAMRELHAAGDIGGARPITHTVLGLDPTVVDTFSRSVASVFDDAHITDGFVGGVERAAVTVNLAITLDGDPSHVTDASWTIRQIAERHGGRYDGWTCAVLGTVPRARRRRRQWRRASTER